MLRGSEKVRLTELEVSPKECTDAGRRGYGKFNFGLLRTQNPGGFGRSGKCQILERPHISNHQSQTSVSSHSFSPQSQAVFVLTQFHLCNFFQKLPLLAYTMKSKIPAYTAHSMVCFAHHPSGVRVGWCERLSTSGRWAFAYVLTCF